MKLEIDGRKKKMQTNECPNCLNPLRPFISSDEFYKGQYYYCGNCDFSTIVDNRLTAARNKWKYDRKNYDIKYWGFRFVNDENENENLTCLEVKESIKPSFYELDLNQIIGHESVKETVIDTVNADKPLNLLLAGTPSTSKTFMMKLVQQQIEEQHHNSTLFIDCATSTFSGLVAEIDRIKPRFIFIDELESFNYQNQSTLLDLLQNQTIHLNKHRNNKTIYLPNLKVIATCNNLSKLLEPLRSRMLTMYLRASTELEYKFISRRMLLKQFDYISEEVAEYIGDITWEIKPAYLRLVNRIGIMIKNDPTKEKVDKIIENLSRYCVPNEELLKLEVQR